jgi:hypothetical protein
MDELFGAHPEDRYEDINEEGWRRSRPALSLETAGGERLALRRGETLLVPYAARACRVTGEVEAVRCLPPEAA